MFETLRPAAPDKILALMTEYRADPRSEKVDLGVGVYRDQHGRTEVMRAVRAAEARLHERQDSKSYVGMIGDADFCRGIGELVLGGCVPEERLRICQAPGGSGALRILAELINRAKPGARIWISDPSWPNHVPLIGEAGLETVSYPYFDAASGSVRFDAMMAALGDAAAGDLVLLHGCCHNPTGANLDLDQWRAVTDLCLQRGLLPFVDIAYQGFGDGLEEDAAGLRLMAAKMPEMVIASSCSKNFAVYRDRVGAALLIARDGEQADVAFGQLLNVTRGMYSMPPDHGAATVGIVLADEALRADWSEELEGMRGRMLRLREGLAAALREHSGSDRFDFVADHRGMFSRLGLTPEQVARLRAEHGIYMVGDSRINVAGLPDDGLDQLAAAIAGVLD